MAQTTAPLINNSLRQSEKAELYEIQKGVRIGVGDGYKTEEVLLGHATNGWVWWNLLCGGVLGFAIDLSNGAAKKLQPDELSIELITVELITALDSNGELRISHVPLISEHQL